MARFFISASCVNSALGMVKLSRTTLTFFSFSTFTALTALTAFFLGVSALVVAGGVATGLLACALVVLVFGATGLDFAGVAALVAAVFTGLTVGLTLAF